MCGFRTLLRGGNLHFGHNILGAIIAQSRSGSSNSIINCVWFLYCLRGGNLHLYPQNMVFFCLRAVSELLDLAFLKMPFFDVKRGRNLHF